MSKNIYDLPRGEFEIRRGAAFSIETQLLQPNGQIADMTGKRMRMTLRPTVDSPTEYLTFDTADSTITILPDKTIKIGNLSAIDTLAISWKQAVGDFTVDYTPGYPYTQFIGVFAVVNNITLPGA